MGGWVARFVVSVGQTVCSESSIRVSEEEVQFSYYCRCYWCNLLITFRHLEDDNNKEDDIVKQQITDIFQSVFKYCEVYGADNYKGYSAATKEVNLPVLKQLQYEVGTHLVCCVVPISLLTFFRSSRTAVASIVLPLPLREFWGNQSKSTNRHSTLFCDKSSLSFTTTKLVSLPSPRRSRKLATSTRTNCWCATNEILASRLSMED